MDSGADGPGVGNEGRGMGDQNLRTGEPSGGGDAQRGQGRTGASGDTGASGAAEGEAGQAGQDRGDRSKRRGGEGKDGARGTEGAGEGEAGRGDRSDRMDRSERRGKDARERGGDRDADADRGAAEGAEGKGKPTGSLTRLEGEKRSEAQSIFRSHRSEALVEDLDVDVSIGVSVPRTVTLHPVPQEIVVLVPEYRAYRYFIYEDRVVVVDPNTFEIVDILVLA